MTTRPDSIAVLHVDDEPGFADMAAEFLEREDDRISVETATSAEEALNRLDGADDGDGFDCVVSDHDMPGLTGIEFLETVRADRPDLPFILFTGKGSEEVASEAISAGVTDYLQKGSGTDQYALLANRIHNAVERTRAEQSRDRHLEAVETAEEGISILDEDGRFVYVNEAYADMFGYAPEELVGEHWEVVYPEDEISFAREEILPTVEDGGVWHGHSTGLRADGSTFPKDHVVAETKTGDLVCTVRDISDRRERERAIETLHSTAQALMRADTSEEVASVAVDAVRDILDMPMNGVFLYDDREEQLFPAAWTDTGEEFVGEIPSFGPGDGLAWEVFETGEMQVHDDVSTVPGRLNPETNVRSEILLPLGEYGVFIVGSAEPDAFDETDVSLARTVATHMRTALGRIDRSRELRSDRRFIEQALDTLDDLFYVLEPDGRVRRWNESLREMTDYTDEQLANIPATELFPQDERQKVGDAIEEALETGSATVQADVLTADGERVPHEFTGTRLTDADGTVTGLVGIGRDVSERERRIRELEQRQSLIEALSTALPDYLFIYDEEGTYLDVLTGWEEGMEMFSPADLVGERVDEMFRGEVADSVQTTIDEVLATGETETVEYAVQPPNAGERWYEGYAAPIPEGYEGRDAVLFAARHITDRKRHEQELHRQNERIESIHDVATTIGACDTADAVYEQVIAAAEEILDFDVAIVDAVEGDVLVPQAVSSKLTDDEYYEETPIDADDNLAAEAYRTGEPSVVGDIRTRGVDPASTAFRSALTVPIGDHGVFQTVDRTVDAFDESDLELVELLLSHADVQLTRLENRRRLRERTQELERQNDRLEEFARVVSHDLRNPLNIVQGRIELAREETDNDHLDDAADAVERSLSLVDDLLTLAREGEKVGEVEAVALAETIDGCWRTVDTGRATLSNEAEMTVYADPSRLKQLLENLFRNAVEHGTGDEPVTVRVGDLEDGRGFYVADDGPGVPEAERERVFDAGYSTATEGTGFGLNIVQEIAEAHGWEVSVTESEAGGARFEITGFETA